MGFGNPPVSWAQLRQQMTADARPPDGGDAPAWSRKRQPYKRSAEPTRTTTSVPYAELHVHSNFSFLDGVSHPEELIEEAVAQGLTAIALTDHDGLYGIVRFAEAAEEHGIATVFGAELSLGLPGPQNGEPDPVGEHLLVLARDPEGYARLSHAISEAQLAGGEKGKPVYDMTRLAAAHDGHWLVLTGCRKGSVRQALATGGPGAAAAALDALVAHFGADNVVVELWDHGNPLDTEINDALWALAADRGLTVVATNNVHYATPAQSRLATVAAAVRARRCLDEMDGWLQGAAMAYVRSGAEMAERFARYPGAVAAAARIGQECAFDLRLVAPRLPDFPVPAEHTEMTWLRELTERGAVRWYGTRDAETAPGAWKQIDHELAIIEKLGFPGYFLVVHDIVEFCRRNGILCQGRGSAANSAVCYSLGITNADAVRCGLLFERFLSTARDGPPDIDIDIESGRREEVIQYMYARHGRMNTAQVANVISYRPRSALRDAARALGYSTGQQDAWSKQIDHYGPLPGSDADTGIPVDALAVAQQLLRFPRHLGIHSGGMVICHRPVTEVCPVEWARMEGRTVLQWDKDDCARVGLVKFDLLGLGMLTALRLSFELLRDHHGIEMTLATIPTEDPAVYDMFCRADTVGVFQIESRAQMATLPRLKPRTFYDLVIEVALIRPGPIQGGSVHPYIRRKNGQEPVTYAHPLLEPSLKRTLGVPLFQEQIMQMAIDIAGLSPGEADELRQAMGSKRSTERMERLRERLYTGMSERGVTGATADGIFDKLRAFANFGFPESHSISFAHLAYASGWLKCHYPAAFCAALLNAQPMGFYSPQSLVADARRHGVLVERASVNVSAALATLEGPRDAPVLRLGLTSVRAISTAVAERIVAAAPYTSMEDLARRARLTATQLEALATAGACDDMGLTRREALWTAGAAAQSTPDRLAGTTAGMDAPMLPGMTDVDLTVADLWATGITPDGHPMEHLRPALDKRGVLRSIDVRTAEANRRVRVAGLVTHRQRPATAGGITFMNLEDETGMVNVICSPAVWERHRVVARTSGALLVRGRLERAEGVVNIVADQLEVLAVPVTIRSRDFH